jgi:hypothetical protein
MNIFITYYTRCWEKEDKIVSNSQGVHGVGMKQTCKQVDYKYNL